MTVGFHSPLPPARSGVADYAAALLAELRRWTDVRVAPEQADLHLYHVGNNSLHQHIYCRALRTPGVVVLHDAVLHHFFLGALDQHAYVQEMIYNYGAWVRDLAVCLFERRWKSAAEPLYFLFPLLRRIAEVSRALIVHNPAAAQMVRQHVPTARVFEVPHLYVAPPSCSPAAVARWRAALGVAPGETLFGLFGYLRQTKRLPSVLRAFHRLRQITSQVKLLIAGEPSSAAVARLLDQLCRAPGVIRLGYLSPSELSPCLTAADVCINLRYPSAGETSGIAIRMLGAGRAVILTRGLENSCFPEHIAVQIDSGLPEEDELLAAMYWLHEDRARRHALGEFARQHVTTHHHIHRVAQQYWQILQEIADAV